MEKSISIDKHTAQSLGKYLGRKIFIDSKGPGLIGTAILNGVDRLEGYLSLFDNLTQTHQDFKLGSGNEVYPILKTVEELHKNKHILASQIDCFSLIWRTECDRVNLKAIDTLQIACILQELLKLGYGAMPNTASPTGYISIHDGLPCEVERNTTNE
jgi:hypothetical protein|tara:strand:+ start:2603 stop:3073 length:471 start_codon:yes stop_codon:yes gene_type:complete